MTLINPPSKLHYLRALRSPALLGCDCSQYGLRKSSLAGAGRRLAGGLRGLGDVSFIPAGSVLNYQATYSPFNTSLNPFNPAFAGSVQGVLSQVQQNLAGQKIQVTRSSYAAQTSGVLQYVITLTIQTGIDYGAVADIKSIVDGAFYNSAGVRQLTSTISVGSLAQPGVNVATQDIGPPVTLPPDDSSFIAPAQPGTDWTTIGLAVGIGVLGVFAVRELL